MTTHEDSVTIIPTNDFATWAKSYAGCDGGNLAAPIWICGIEYGMGEKDILNHEFKPITKPRTWTPDELPSNWYKHQYDRKTLKLYSAIARGHVNDWKNFVESRQAFSENSDVFKMNLYPLAFKGDVDGFWQKEYYQKTNIPTKEMYRAWCQVHRFGIFNEWTSKHQTTLRLVIGTGVTRRRDFVWAFKGRDHIYDPLQKSSGIGEQDLSLYWMSINNDKTLLVIIPFLGWRKYDLNSDEKIVECGKKIRKLCDDKYGQAWLDR